MGDDLIIWSKLIELWEENCPGWHTWEASKRQIPDLIDERQRMIDAGELIPKPA